ncbi:Flp pilus assembly protein, pilin Flp [Enhydrobacter aerosaccus]|uniref:Flp pilus assembly protein, pilin Flp n=1 Tax=Enhydrobacter aerosaccus TaxID=225324 RepID=A0A1T4JJY1_9HYPH|nr:Flp family type IVb pilin [Enhydrobacter aerosaccus]SJZ30471.1 Flp pilus assembly protein, pilin Flp [Enhydrobacter aerosaccus]
MSAIFRRLVVDDQASTAIEYSLIAGLISIAAVSAFTSIGQKVMNFLAPITSAL